MSAAAGRREATPEGMSIGSVLALLRPEFPDVSISKIRFLEDQGLVEPERTPAGYRKFSHQDVERLRYVLGVQRDHYLPLRVIRDQLDALDQGLEPPLTRGAPGSPQVPGSPDLPGSTRLPASTRLPGSPRLVGPIRDGAAEANRSHDLRLSRRQFLEATGIGDDVLSDLESHGLVVARANGGYDADAVLLARTAGELAAFGIEPRHLRAFRSSADREAGLVEQVVSPLRRQRGPEAAAHAEEVTREVSALCIRLHAALVKAALERGGS